MKRLVKRRSALCAPLMGSLTPLTVGAAAAAAAAGLVVLTIRRRRILYYARLPKLTFLDSRLAIVRLPAAASVKEFGFDPDLPQHRGDAKFFSITRSAVETSVVVDERLAPKPSATCQVEAGWVVFRLEGPLDFSLVGILSRIATTLAVHKISIFAMSTYDTDYVLLKHESKGDAIDALRRAGYVFSFSTCSDYVAGVE